jgi:aspartokinase-like uncharacterized kinase
MRPAVRIVKIGGSLFDMPQLASRLRAWLAAQTPAKNVLLMGGGPLADALRQADALHHLGEEQSHWLCVRALSVTARLLAAMLPEANLIDDVAQLARWIEDPQGLPVAVVFDMEPFLRHGEASLPPAPVPHCWSVTTDSLAARLAEVIDADELALLKSADPPPGGEVVEWSHQGYVDPWFAHIARRLRAVRCINLRAFQAVP